MAQNVHDPWFYYRILEESVLAVSRCVAFTNENKSAYGDEIAGLIVCVGSELDTNMKMLLGVEKGNIVSYIKAISVRCNGIQAVTLTIQNTKMTVTPYRSIDVSGHKALGWWASYNAVKHNRYKNIKEANVENLVHLIGGLYIINSLIGVKINRLRPVLETKLFGNPGALLAANGGFGSVPSGDSDEKYFGYRHKLFWK
jgi:hypothetical protein